MARKHIETKTKEAANRLQVSTAATPAVQAAAICGNKWTDKQIESYNFHRRSLRIWPIKGPEIAKNTKSFIQTKLKITGSAYDGLGKMELKKERLANSRFPEEVIVIFETKEARDTVKAAGKNLGGETTAGMRLNVPGFLLDNYRILASIGYNIKESKRDVKRAIKFDDENLDLMLDIRVDNEWRRISPSEARTAARENPNIRIGPKRMQGGDIAAMIGEKKTAVEDDMDDVHITEVVVVPASTARAAGGQGGSSQSSSTGSAGRT